MEICITKAYSQLTQASFEINITSLVVIGNKFS